MRAKLMRLSDDFRACDTTVVATGAAAIDGATGARPDLILVSAAFARRHADEVQRLALREPRVPVLVAGGAGFVRGGASDRGAEHGGAPPGDAGAISLRATSELGALFFALGGEPGGGPPVREPGLRRRTARAAVSDPTGATTLTETECDILRALAVGATTAQVATSMGVSEQVIDAHLAAVMHKLHGRDDISRRAGDGEPSPPR